MLEFAQWFWRKRFVFNFVNVFLLFRFCLTLEKGVALHLNKIESPSPRDALCKFCWPWPRCYDFERARTTNGKYGPVSLSKNEHDWEGHKEWLFSKWIPANFMSVVMTSISNRFLHYDVINSVIITEIWPLCWN